MDTRCSLMYNIYLATFTQFCETFLSNWWGAVTRSTSRSRHVTGPCVCWLTNNNDDRVMTISVNIFIRISEERMQKWWKVPRVTRNNVVSKFTVLAWTSGSTIFLRQKNLFTASPARWVTSRVLIELFYRDHNFIEHSERRERIFIANVREDGQSIN